MPKSASATIAEWKKDHPDEEVEPSPEPEAPAPESEAQGEPAPPQERVSYSLDDLLPDDERIPPSFRGKPLHALIEDRHQIDMRAKDAGFQKNRAEAQAEANQRALEILVQKIEQLGRPAAPSAPKPSELLAARGIDPNTNVFNDPFKTVDVLAEVTRETVRNDLDERNKILNDKLAEIERTQYQLAVKAAFDSVVKRTEGMQDEDWNNKTQLMSALLWGKNYDPRDPRAWQEVNDWYNKQVAQRPAGAATPPAPSSAPAPPVGNGRTAPVQQSKARPKVSTHTMAAFESVTNVLKRMGSKATTESILEKMRQDPRYRGEREMFE